jgi:hypothetical protein
MKYYRYNKSPLMSRELLLYILQVVTIYNAIILGWEVKKIGIRTYKLSKKIKDLSQFELTTFLKEILPGF